MHFHKNKSNLSIEENKEFLTNFKSKFKNYKFKKNINSSEGIHKRCDTVI